MKKLIAVIILLVLFLTVMFSVNRKPKSCEVRRYDSLQRKIEQSVIDVEVSVGRFIDSNSELLISVKELDSVLLEIRKTGDQINSLKTVVEINRIKGDTILKHPEFSIEASKKQK